VAWRYRTPTAERIANQLTAACGWEQLPHYLIRDRDALCLDHIVVIGEQHLRHILKCYMEYYNAARTHLSLGKDARVRRLIQRTGRIQGRPVLGGLHHRYVRI
jgi:hypothetical protein